MLVISKLRGPETRILYEAVRANFTTKIFYVKNKMKHNKICGLSIILLLSKHKTKNLSEMHIFKNIMNDINKKSRTIYCM